MNSVHKLTLATLIIAAPSFAVAQGKAPHLAPPVVMGKSAPVRQDNRADKIGVKTERKADQKLLTKGIRLTSAEKKQFKAIEKKYDTDYRSLRQSKLAADKAAKKTAVGGSHAGLKTVPQPVSDATFKSQLVQLQTQERSDMRAVLTPQQQAIFDSNLTKLSTRK
jgi:Spy/CpxP family protein refolding chaperone